MSELSAEELVGRLELARHPEGGWYRESYRSMDVVPAFALPEKFGGPRACCTAIYFLLERGEISALHRIKSDELWHFHAGTTLTIHVITQLGEHLTWIRGRLSRRWCRPAAGSAPSCRGRVPMPWSAAPSLPASILPISRWGAALSCCTNFRSMKISSGV